MTTKTMVTTDAAVTEPIILKEGDEVSLQVIVPHVTSGITGTPTQKFFKRSNRTDLASTYLTGSSSVIGTNTIQTKQTTGLKAGEWVMSVKATVDGQTYTVATIPVIVKREDEL